MAEQRADLLFEIGVEEIPAPAVLPALTQLERFVADALAEARLEHGEVRTWGTPRRLAIMVADVALRQPDLEQEVKGPPAAAAFDDAGNPTKAAAGLRRRARAERRRPAGARRPTRAATSSPRSPSRDATPSRCCPRSCSDAIAALTFPKTMRWGEPRLPLRAARSAGCWRCSART